ncbi:hypothetical protein EVJ50_00620 [Synechococcus sp. RSCCF101]|uniref:hypothetical protein n=1 Tax=Synechococcus sp. RSCCF101 TaxID=2511069 RepID=UPI0012475C8D|nr:hypothetical protein [Synechococcus sp. RSCCF101]QEY30977.1 hypothetical protein EVJ50_00620 [Synechococcus sp. RSCCF101]
MLQPCPSWGHHASPAERLSDSARSMGGSAAEQVIASELSQRGASSPALAMMVASVGRMVNAGAASPSRWSAGA